jgi:polyketide cyclase/dehydrase/lipid transport protein
MQRTGERGANALKQELVVRVEATSRASADEVYAVLADLSTHTVWAGEQQAKKTRLLTIDAPPGPATVGTEFSSTGSDPMGSFADRSVVTEAQPGNTFEFVTESRFSTKKGRTSDWTNIERYELEPTADGCRIVCVGRVTRMSELVGMLKLFNVPVLRGLVLKASARVTGRTVRNLARYAEEQQG